MKTSKLGFEQLNDRVVLSADIGGLVSEAPEPTSIVFAGGWGMAQYQYANEATYNYLRLDDSPKDFTSQEMEARDAFFVSEQGTPTLHNDLPIFFAPSDDRPDDRSPG